MVVMYQFSFPDVDGCTNCRKLILKYSQVMELGSIRLATYSHMAGGGGSCYLLPTSNSDCFKIKNNTSLEKIYIANHLGRKL